MDKGRKEREGKKGGGGGGEGKKNMTQNEIMFIQQRRQSGKGVGEERRGEQ